ncbi:MAG TPA: hypothetical protein VE153_35050 [Myxococcus sp.]|nr:hypothetical protein [Myxococcus sp.]
MGLLDWLFRKLAPPAPAPQPAVPPGPPPVTEAELPMHASISHYDASDGVGSLELENLHSLHFERSACDGFDPLHVAMVEVVSLEPDARHGWRAKAVRRVAGDESEARLAFLDAKEARRAGLLQARPEAAAEAAAATAQALAYASVLLPEPPPSTPSALAAWLKELGVEARGFTVSAGRDVVVSGGGHDLRVEAAPGRFPRELLDPRYARGLSDEAGFVSVSCGLPEMNLGERLMRGPGYPDPWAPDGKLRVLSRLMDVLARAGTSVVLHRAGTRVVDSQRFVRMLGNLEDPECRPFPAWLDCCRVDDGRIMRTYGMDAFGLPDLWLKLDAPEDPWHIQRAAEAVQFPAYIMMRENRLLADGERVEVPVGLLPGAWPSRLDGDRDAFVVRAGGTAWMLERVPGGPDAFARWARASAPRRADPSHVAPNSYQALFVHGLERVLPGELLAELSPPDQEGLPPHRVLVRTRDAAEGYVLITNGFGRVPQPGGDVDAGNVHQELAAWMDSHDPQKASALSTLGLLMHVHSGGDEAWKAGDTLVLPEPLLGLRHFVLARGPEVHLPPGSPVQVLWVIPVSGAEYAQVRGAAGAWAEPLLGNPERHAELRRRWTLGMN